jgi:two-component system C4-dicarboxylate transport response regulator DctD
MVCTDWCRPPRPHDLLYRLKVADRFVLGLDGNSLLTGGARRIKSGTLTEQLAHFEQILIADMLRRPNGNIAKASEELGIPKKTLYHKVRQMKFPAEDARSEGADA